MSFRLSSGTLDSMAGVYAPPKKYRLGSGGGKGKPAKAGGAIMAFAVASMIPKNAAASGGTRPSMQAKHAFGGSSQASTSGRAIATMERTARRAPEVMVRVTGRQHGAGHVLANFSYISRLGHGADKQLALYSSDGDVLRDGRDMQVLAQDWQEWEMGGDARRKGATAISMILSMPAGTDPDRVREAALGFARQEFSNRSWVASLHVDRDHPHVHLTFARRDHDGRRFHPDRDDLFRYRQRFAERLRDHGIEANATPARARGLDPKHEHIAARKVREKGGVPRIDQSRAARVQGHRERGVSDPVKAVLSNQQETVRRAYERSIAELAASPSLADQVIAKTLETFVATMPDPVPNSVRMPAIVPSHDLGAGRASGPAVPSRAADGDDPLTAALARSRAMRDRIEGDPGHETRADSPRDGDGTARPSGVSDRLRSLMEEANRPPSPQEDRSADEILRQAREREERERDRSRDREGPIR